MFVQENKIVHTPNQTIRPENGVTILSRVNDLRLEINPLTTRLEENSGERLQNWGNAAAVLYWQGRIVPGRVIYEGLTHHNWNRLTGSDSDWDNFQGFYLAIQDVRAALCYAAWRSEEREIALEPV